MDRKQNAWCEELFEKMKLNEKNPFPGLEKPIKETMGIIFGLIGEREYAPQIRSVFSDYMNKSVGNRLRSVNDYGAFHPEGEIKQILAGIVNITKKYIERTNNNGSEDTSGMYRNMLFKMKTFYIPKDSDGSDSLHPESVSIVPRRQPKNYKRKYDFDPEL